MAPAKETGSVPSALLALPTRGFGGSIKNEGLSGVLRTLSQDLTLGCPPQLFDYVHGFSLPSFLRFHTHPTWDGWMRARLSVLSLCMLVLCLQICFWDDGGPCPTVGTSDTRKAAPEETLGRQGVWCRAGE